MKFASPEEAEALWGAEEGRDGILGKIVKFAGIDYTALSCNASTDLGHQYTLVRKVDSGLEILNVRAARKLKAARENWYKSDRYDSFSAYATSAKIIPLV